MENGKAIATAIAKAAAPVALGAAAGAGAILALRHRVRATCRPFFAASKAAFRIPGIDAGFVSQDMFYLEGEDLWLFSGYEAPRKGPSPLYVRHADADVRRLTVELPDGTTYRGHGAAVTAHGAFVFLTVEDGYVVLRRAEVAGARDGDAVRSFAHVPVELEPAFMNAQDGTLYIGEFYHRRAYPTPRSHWVSVPSAPPNPALMYAYAADAAGLFGFAGQATAVYSIPGDVQGMCLAPNGRMVLSRSWGFGDASLLVYDISRIERRGDYLVDGHRAPLFVLDGRSLAETLTVPPMAEGIDYHDGRVFLPSESASNLYLLGKAFGGKRVYEVDLD